MTSWSSEFYSTLSYVKLLLTCKRMFMFSNNVYIVCLCPCLSDAAIINSISLLIIWHCYPSIYCPAILNFAPCEKCLCLIWLAKNCNFPSVSTVLARERCYSNNFLLAFCINQSLGIVFLAL